MQTTTTRRATKASNGDAQQERLRGIDVPPRRREPTREQFAAYRGMFDHLNRALFNGELPEVVLNFSRHANSYGFFAPFRWQHLDGATRTHEISINPDTLLERDPRAVASTLAHEMVHLWQQEFGTPPRRGYHDKEWAAKMESIGLMPSDTGAPGGKKVGQNMTHYIIEGGAFARAFETMPEAFLLPWRSGSPSRPRSGGASAAGGEDEGNAPAPAPKRRDLSKVKYTCPGCGVNVWGKLGLRIACADCVQLFCEA